MRGEVCGRIIAGIVVGCAVFSFSLSARLYAQCQAEVIAYVREENYNTDIYLLDVWDASAARLTSDPADEYSPNWPPDGLSFAYVYSGIGSDIFVRGLDSGAAINVTKSLRSDAPYYRDPAWSPDGNRLAYTVIGMQAPGLYLLDTTGMTEVRLTGGLFGAETPDWSPDGKRLVFAGYDVKNETDAEPQIFSIDADGSHLIKLTEGVSSASSPSWSPDGATIAFSSDRDGNWELYAMDSDGKKVRRLTFEAEVDAEPDWSPDGKQIAFSSKRTGNWEIYVMNADGSNVRQLTDEPYVVHQTPRWRPDACAVSDDGVNGVESPR